MLDRDDQAVEILDRAHHAYLERKEIPRAAYCAGWIGMTLFYNGAVGPAGGWIARANRLLEDVPEETAVHGYALLPIVFRHEAAGDFEAAAAVAGEAAAIGKRHGDSELMALAIHAQGHMLVLAGRVPEGLALLDEAMVAVTTPELSPFVVGIVYCGVILACQEVFEARRAQEWTAVLTEWCAGQPDVVAIQRTMIRQLVVAGCRYVHIDAPGYTAYVDQPSLAEFETATRAVDKAADDEDESEKLSGELASDATVLAPGAVILPIAIYK